MGRIWSEKMRPNWDRVKAKNIPEAVERMRKDPVCALCSGSPFSKE